MSNIRSLIALALLACSLSCLAADPYLPPSGEKSSLGTITGASASSKTSKPEPVYVLAVDGQLVKHGSENWNQELAISPGKHSIAIALKGVYQEFPIDVCAGCTYQANADFSEIKKTFVTLMESEFWITQEPEGSLVTDKQIGKPIPVKTSIIFVRY